MGDVRLKDQVRDFLASMPDEPPLWETPVATLRAQVRDLLAPSGSLIECGVEDVEIQGALNSSRARIYRPSPRGQSESPALVYIHGGGWVVGDLESEDASLRRLAIELGHPIVSLDYVLAPEHPFPSPLEDVIALFQEVRRRAPEWGLEAQRLALGGTSAGANLALATALSLTHAKQPPPFALLLMSGAFDLTFASPSIEKFAEGYFLTAEDMRFFRGAYCPDREQWTNWKASPLFGELCGLPPTILLAAEADPLVDDSKRLAERMREANVRCEFHIEPGQIHAWTSFIEIFSDADRSLRDVGETLARWFESDFGHGLPR
jgi:acetyl esterase